MTITDCKNCQNYLPDLLLDAEAVPAEIAAHVRHCAPCAQELSELKATLAVMGVWAAPEPSSFFDAKLHARLREAQAAEPEGLWERMTSFMRFSTGFAMRPAMAGALGLALLLGGGTAATVLVHHNSVPAVASPLVNDLKIYDNNAQAVDQMDLLDDPATPDGAPQT